MHSLIAIVGVVLNGKENFPEWSRNIKHTLIFNDLWDGICEGEDDSGPTKPTTDKELAIWKNKDKKAYSLIVARVSKEASCHIISIKDSYGALKKLKDLYDSHSELELIQLLVKFFNLELKDDDPMALAFEIKAIMHNIDATGVKIDIPLTTFIKALYLTYSHYLESLQASGQMKSITFDSLVEKVEEHEKAFGKKTTQTTGETVCLARKGKNQSNDSSRGEGSKRGCGRKNFRGKGVGIIKVRDLIFTVSIAARMDLRQKHAESLGRRSKTSKIRKKTKIKYQIWKKVKHLNLLIILLPIAILE
jgi:hypothetical protein